MVRKCGNINFYPVAMKAWSEMFGRSISRKETIHGRMKQKANGKEPKLSCTKSFALFLFIFTFIFILRGFEDFSKSHAVLLDLLVLLSHFI